MYKVNFVIKSCSICKTHITDDFKGMKQWETDFKTLELSCHGFSGWALESLELTHEIANLYGQKLLTVTLNIQLNYYNL